jgi:hypothetical protein
MRSRKSSPPLLFIFKLFRNLQKAIRPCFLSLWSFEGKKRKGSKERGFGKGDSEVPPGLNHELNFSRKS